MTDVKLVSQGQDFVLKFRLGDFESDDGLETAIYVSLFTDRRVADDELPSEEDDRRGWWGDIALDNSTDKIGSKLWLLDRAKLNEETRKRAEDYVLESLEWMKEDGIAETITCKAYLVPTSRIDLEIDIFRPKDKNKYFYRFQLLWESQYMNITKV